jgi:hypothetical protein
MKKYCLIILGLIATSAIQAQFNFRAANVIKTTSSYTDISSTGNEVIYSSNGINFIDFYGDDASAPMNIGFNFSFNGKTFTQLTVNSNGFVKLGGGSSYAGNYNVLANADSNVLAPLNCDLTSYGFPQVFVQTSSISPKVCTIQFNDFAPNQAGGSGSPVFTSMNFQIRLYEGSNNIEFVYGSFVPDPLAGVRILETVCGVMGNISEFSVNASKVSTTAFPNATFIDGAYTNNKFNLSASVVPAVGTTYRFVSAPPPVIDASVFALYTLGEVPLQHGFPQRVSAVIKNRGSDTLKSSKVYLNITGLQTVKDSITIGSLVPEGTLTVTFGDYGLTSLGNYTVSVSVPSDGDNSNNSKSVRQVVNSNLFSYADSSKPTGKVGYGTSTGTILVKYANNFLVDVYVHKVKVHISNDINNIGRTVYAVVRSSTGADLGRSADLVIQASDTGRYVDFTMTTNVLIVRNASFFVGLAQTQSGFVIKNYEPVSYQFEGRPTRSNAYYAGSLAPGAPTMITDQNRFMIQAEVSVLALPVDIVSFNALAEGAVNKLNWKVENEEGLEFYSIERSERGTGFSEIGRSKAEGLSRYEFMDENPLRGMNYYRLKMVDADGNVKYSEIRMVRNDRLKMNFVIYPNPVRQKLNVRYDSNSDGAGTITIINESGIKVSQYNILMHKGGGQWQADLSGLAAGLYYLRLDAGGDSKMEKLIKQ